MNVVVLKYNAGNIYSVVNALRRLGVEPLVTDDVESLMNADRVIVPGQGEASNTMSYLRERRMDEVIRNFHQPVLGICIGQQLFCSSSAEGNTQCMGIFPDIMVTKFVASEGQKLKIPHIGWNTIDFDESCPLFKGLQKDSYVYYVHSFYVPECEYSIATTNYGGIQFTAAMCKDNFYATQFHPEKSGEVGEQILRNFLTI